MIRRSLLAAAGLCALSGTSLADPPPSREYPPTYSSRKAPWYDPYGLFKSSEKKPQPVAPSSPVAITQSPTGTLPSAAAPVIHAPAHSGTSPDWKWYGYGAPVPANAATGSLFHTPKINAGPSIPIPQPTPLKDATEPVPVIRIEPLPAVPAEMGPTLPSVVPPTGSNAVEWKSSAAQLKPPTPEPSPTSTEAPLATLKAPVASDAPARPVEKRFVPRTRAEALRGPGPAAPDIPVVPAPGIVMPSK
jgi:hypothetical protein